MKYLLFVVVAFTLSLSAFSGKKSLQISDFAYWKRIENRQISSDGQFVAYELNKQKGDGMLIVHSIQNQKTDTILYGKNAKFAANSKFIVFNIALPEDSLRKLKLAKTAKDKMPKESMGLLNLTTHQVSTFAKVKSFQLADEDSNWLSYTIDTTKTVVDKKVKKDETSTDKDFKKSKEKKVKENYLLKIWDPINNVEFSFNRIDTFSIAAKGFQIAYLNKNNDSTKLKTMVVFDPRNQKADTILRDSATIKQIKFDEKGQQLAFLQSTDTAKIKNYSLKYTPTAKIKITNILNTKSKLFIQEWIPSENGNLYFSKDGSKLFFGSSPKQIEIKKDSVLDEDKPKLDLWSYTDTQIQPMQLKQLAQKKKQSFTAVYQIKDKSCIQIADTTIENIRLYNFNNADIALGIDDKSYEKQMVWTSRSLNNYYLIDLKTGQKTSLLKERNNLSLSNTGKYAVWFDFKDLQYHLTDTKTLKSNIISTEIPNKLYDEKHDTPNDPEAYGIAGWTENDDYLILYDRYDLWKIDPKGKEKALKLTNGRNQKIKYRYVETDKEINFIPLKKELVLSTFNEKNNTESYCSMLISQPNNIQTLVEGDFMLGGLLKAKNDSHILWSTQTVSEFPEVKYSSPDFKNPLTLSVANPQQQDYIWPTVEMVEWNSFGGDSLQGLLYKPNNFDPNRKYPMMVYFYERNSENKNRYNYPQPSRSTISIPFYVSNEYLVFVPDIVYKDGYPGQSAYDCIISGVQKLINNCTYVDEKHIALQGQSWGGYQTAYLVTKTNMFAAGMAGAPVSNMTSAYGGIRWGTGMSRMFQYEETQSRIGGTLWQKPMHYIENSPLFGAEKVNTPLLIMANDNDGAVPWYQGIEFFMALYRLQKPVWLINYNGMDHNLEAKYWANRIDLSTRMFGFFNHYLKGQPAPEWLTKGIPAIKKGESLGY